MPSDERHLRMKAAGWPPLGSGRPATVASTLRRITTLPGWEKALRSIENRRPWLDQVHLELTQIPAPTFLESARAEYIREKFCELGLQRVRVDSVGNVLGERPGKNETRAESRNDSRDESLLAITAHMDTVVPPGVPIEVNKADGRFYAPGISDNGAGLAALLGIAAALGESQIPTEWSLLFVATVGEEGEGDLCGMRRLFAQRDICRRTRAVLVLDGASVQRTSVTGLGSRRFRVEITGPGGHSWSDFGRVNPIHALSDAILHLRRLPLLSNPRGVRGAPHPRTSLNIGVVHGGTAVNVIPDSAWMKLDIRSTDAAELERMSNEMQSAVRAAVEAENQRGTGLLEASIVPIGHRPAAELPPDARILEVIREVDRLYGIDGRFEAASTDANIPLSLGIEAITTGGGGNGGGAHTPNEWYDPQGRDLGLKRILLAALALAHVADENAPPSTDSSAANTK